MIKKTFCIILLASFSLISSSCNIKSALDTIKGDIVQVNSKGAQEEKQQHVQTKDDLIVGELGKVKRLYISQNEILFSDLGLKKVSDSVKCIRKEGDTWINADWKTDLHIGMNNVEVLENNGEITSIKMHEGPDFSYIRVALTQDVNKTNDDNINFSKITLKSKNGFFIESSKGNSYIEDESMDITSDSGLVILSTQSEKYTYNEEVRISPRLLYITIPSINRGGSESIIPKYYGLIEICNLSGDIFNVINELPIETYVKCVIPSEISSNSNDEALKVQAILSRTFAYREFLSNKYSSEGYWVEDSVSSQVYNNKDYNDKVEKAVSDTKGLVIKNPSGDLEYVYYYSTSSGFSSTPTQVWYRGGALTEDPTLPCQSFLYDESGKDKIGLDNLTEEKLASIYKNLKLKSPDGASPFFRWKFSLNKDELKNTIESNLAYLHDNNPDLILFKDDNGNFVRRDGTIYSIGDIEDIHVEERGTGGNVIELSIKGTDDEILIIGEYYIRNMLRPSKVYTKGDDVMLYMATSGADDYMNNLTRINYSLMPSTFLTFDINKVGDLIDSITFYGGGNGHGAGISQNGMIALSLAGEKYDEIINTYMTNVKIESIE
ncbi:MAG: SpoIID/LytB domain-containing protein [Oscillospiraceae bacterium]|nr:SpoIID/LytB domain-containing protein [Oscillospiraceae bacterium]